VGIHVFDSHFAYPHLSCIITSKCELIQTIQVYLQEKRGKERREKKNPRQAIIEFDFKERRKRKGPR
jgi:hypothetical protein